MFRINQHKIGPSKDETTPQAQGKGSSEQNGLQALRTPSYSMPPNQGDGSSIGYGGYDNGTGTT